MTLSPQAKLKIVAQFPELRDWLEGRETNQLLSGLFSQIKLMKGDKGDKGDIPRKGVDYFTDAEVGKIINYILTHATPVKGKHYFDGIKGDSYVLTSKDKAEIAGKIEVPIVERIIEKTEVIKEVMPKSFDVSIVKGAVSKKELEIEKKTIIDGMTKVDGRIKLIDQRWHGAGLSQVSHDGTLTGTGAPSSPLSVVGSGGNSGYQTPVSGVIDGVNATFTWATAPKAIVVDQGRTMQKVNSAPDSNINWTGTTTTILQIPPNRDIFAVA